MSRALFLGVDVGTEGARAVLFEADGTPVADATVPYATVFPRPGWAEQDPDAIWAALCTAVRGAVDAAGGAAPVALSLASTAVTVVAVDADARPLRPALLWMDARASEEAATVDRSGHPVLWHTGGHVSPEWMLPKAMWLKRHEPDIYARTHRLVEVHDWLVFLLTGRWCLALATVSAEWSYDVAQSSWPADLLELAGLDDVAGRWPADVLPAGTVVGGLTAQAAGATGLPRGLPVAQGLMDSFAAALACNVFAPGRVTLSLGSSSCYLALTRRPVSDERLLGPIGDAFGRGTWAMQGGQTSAGSLLRWFRDELAPASTYRDLDREAATAAPNRVHALDTWQGSRSPHRDPRRRGAFWGLSLGHRRADLYRALLEAVAYGGREILEVFRETGIDGDAIVATGGGARSPLWMQIHADVLGRRVDVIRQDHPAALGAAICAMVGAGVEVDLPAAAARTFQPGASYPPAAVAATYETGYLTYRNTAEALRPQPPSGPDGGGDPATAAS